MLVSVVNSKCSSTVPNMTQSQPDRWDKQSRNSSGSHQSEGYQFFARKIAREFSFVERVLIALHERINQSMYANLLTRTGTENKDVHCKIPIDAQTCYSYSAKPSFFRLRERRSAVPCAYAKTGYLRDILWLQTMINLWLQLPSCQCSLVRGGVEWFVKACSYSLRRDKRSTMADGRWPMDERWMNYAIGGARAREGVQICPGWKHLSSRATGVNVISMMEVPGIYGWWSPRRAFQKFPVCAVNHWKTF